MQEPARVRWLEYFGDEVDEENGSVVWQDNPCRFDRELSIVVYFEDLVE